MEHVRRDKHLTKDGWPTQPKDLAFLIVLAWEAMNLGVLIKEV